MKKATALILCLFLTLSVLAVSFASEAVTMAGGEFIVPNIIPAKGIEDFIGEWVFYLIKGPNGIEMDREEMLEKGDVDERANITITEDTLLLYAPSTGELEPVKHEFNAEDGSLKVINEEAENTIVLFLTDNGMLVFFEPDVDNREATMYLSRKE